MNMKKTIGICAAFLAALLCAVPRSAQATGKIRSVDVYDPDSRYTFPNAGNAMKVKGEKVRIRFRLANLDWTVTHTNTTYTLPWTFMYAGQLTGDETLDRLNELAAQMSADRPRLGLWVSGGLREVMCSTNSWPGVVSDWLAGNMDGEKHYTDLEFEYSVQNGDFALPIQLANASGTGPATGDEPYYLKSNLWALRAKPTWSSVPVTAEFAFGPSNLRDDPDFSVSLDPDLSTWEMYAQNEEKKGRDFDLSEAGAYVQALDFDDPDSPFDPADPERDFNPESDVWRKIPQGSWNGADPRTPALAIAGGAANSMDLYLWTADTNVAEIVKKGAVEEVRQYVFSDGVTRTVGRIHINAGSQLTEFYLKATGAVDDTTRVFLAATPTNILNKSGDIVPNFISRIVKVGESLPPSISVKLGREDQPGKLTLTADANDAQSQVSINVELTAPYSRDIEVPVKVTMLKDATIAATNYVGLSWSETGDNLSWDDSIMVRAGSLSASVTDSSGRGILYLYANRGSADTKSPGLKVEVDTNRMDAAALEYFTGKPGYATVFINPSTPTVTTDLSGLYAAEAGTPKTFTINVSDAYGERDGPYTVKWRYDSPASTEADYTTLPATVTRTESGASISFDVPISATKSAGIYSNYFHVVNMDSVSSAPDTQVALQVTAPLSTGMKCKSLKSKFPENSYSEQDVVEISFAGGFSMPERYGQASGYLFLIPQSENASNRVICADADLNDDSDWKQGIEIGDGQDSVTVPMYLLDGSAGQGTKMRYQAVIRTAGSLDEGQLVSEWGTAHTFDFNVTNVVPTVYSVTMGSETLKVNGGQMTYHAAVNVSKKLSASAGPRGQGEPSEIDLYADEDNIPNYADHDVAFTSKWKFRYDDGSEDPAEFVYGPPARGLLHTFRKAGVCTVTVEFRDKDMFARSGDEWPEENEFTFTVVVDPKPSISLTPHYGTGAFTENEAGAPSQIDVGLSLVPSEEVTVQLTVERKGPLTVPEAEYPPPELSTTTLTFGGDSPNTTSASFNIKKMDGTWYTEDPGFVIRAEVVSPGENEDGVAWSNLYRKAELDITIANVAPEITTIPSTNVVERAINTPFEINYAFKDNLIDMAAGEMLYWTIEGESPTNYVVSSTASPYRGKFSTMFTSSGSKTVTLQVVDKDQGESTIAVWYFVVKASKKLIVYPRQPDQDNRGNGGVTTLSMKWTTAAGIGDGRVWANGAMKQFDAFRHEYTYAPGASSALAYAHGYNVGDVDDGTLGPAGSMDYAVTKEGHYPATGNYYVSEEASGLDSFFYAWLLTSSDQQSSGGETTVLKLAPAYGAANTAEVPVTLPPEEKDATSYPDTFLEAIFAKEYLTTDNVGDLNQDGIPDIYAVQTSWGSGDNAGTLLEIMGGSVDDAGDVKMKFNAYNVDADYLPSRSFTGGLPSTVDGWSTLSVPFSALTEIRGFHEGLNHRTRNDGLNVYVRGPWVSVPCFSEAETNAVAYWNGLQTWADFAKEHAEDEEADYADAVAEWQTAFDAKLREDRSWIPEKRTDPTLWDTDDDNFPDGYEYTFWYQAAVGWMDNGEWKQMKGSRFRLEDIALGEEITPAEIMAAFDPTVKATGDIAKRDTDNDGLTDLEELALGTNPVHWDTDGDGMSDLWEVMRGMNPLKVPENRQEWNLDSDYMASFTTEKTYAIAKFTNAEGATVYYAVPDNGGSVFDALENGDQDDDQNGDDPAAVDDDDGEEGGLTNITAIAVYRYGGKDSDYTPYSRGSYGVYTNISYMGNVGKRRTISGSKETWGEIRIATAKPLDAAEVDISELTFVSLEKNKALRLVHDQVYAQFGFDPRTGWGMNVNGCVCNRWDPNMNPTFAKDAGDAGLAVNTAPYSNLDEYLVLKYRYMAKAADTGAPLRKLDDDLAKIAAEELTIASVLAAGTTNPNVPFEKADYNVSWTPVGSTQEAGTDEAQGTANLPTYTGKNHGADTDEDGVPDGWELYVSFNPNNKNDGNVCSDGDLLALADEYAGTDSCNAYSNALSIISGSDSDSGSDSGNKVATIYKNHPGNTKGWFNKFFPSDPWSIDTDGDGLSDLDEGASWSGTFLLGRSTDQSPLAHTYTFIYGDPEDDQSLCIRGGGLNPCSVDTDFDLLPDPWEHDFAGVVFKAGAPWKPGDSQYGTAITLGAGVLDTINRNDAINTSTGALSVAACYITAGMDGTFGPRKDNASIVGDAVTSYTQVDPRTGTKRNFDFDNDGLQNFQEYLVQSLRHLRYDDTETPLMGSYLPNGLNGTRTYVKFLPMQAWDGAEFYKTAKGAGFTGLSAYGGEGFRYRDLGYFIRPPQAWDPIAQDTVGINTCVNYAEPGFRVMLRPAGLSPNATATAGNGRPAEDRMSARSYASTDPRLWDSDDDGMDDYYELFHGLNPLLGGSSNGSDVIQDAYSISYDGIPFSSLYNAWVGWPAPPMLEPEYDAMKYPWFMGVAEADADGDGLRNADEALLVNTPSPQNYHTDPSPLWMTDSSAKTSFTKQYYCRDVYMTEAMLTPDLTHYFWFEYVDGADEGGVMDFMFSFEENEGYDTDHDGIPDGHEATTTVNASTSAQNPSDPDRRQAVYLPGENAALISYSGDFSRPVGENYAMLRQFTVEAWIRPEVAAGSRTIVTRVSDYPGDTAQNAVHQLRANFRIGINEQGIIYGQYDTDDAVSSGSDFGTTTVLGVTVENDVWTHVALTFNGSALVLYVNGREVGRESSNLIPANGIVLAHQSVTPVSADFGKSGYSKVPSRLVVGADAAKVDALLLNGESSWANYGSFYKGWIDEVRVWDGARTDAQINADYKKRYSLADLATLRDEVYAMWLGGGTHNDNDGRPNLPAELLLHYNFQQLPSEVTADYVSSEPSGFTSKVIDNVKWDGHGVDLRCGWWAALPLASTVYGNRAYVPWVRNTSGMLPAMDGSTPDSRYWSELLGGVTFPAEVGVLSFSFPNTACPYAYWNYMGESYFREWLLNQLRNSVDAAFNSMAKNVEDRFRFEERTGFVGGADLLPLGGVYAKRCTDFWDELGVTDSWTATADDIDDDDIPDWWEALYAGVNGNPAELTPTTVITYNGRQVTAREAYLRDLAKGLLPGGSLADLPTAYASKVDRNYNDIPDWWESIYGLDSTGAWSDADSDQLSDYTEWLIAEGFSYANASFPVVSPVKARSFQGSGQVVPDYFLPVGSLYLGGMFADHDFMEDAWEVNFPKDLSAGNGLSTGTYDAHLDPDEDGWSNFAECRAGTSPLATAYLGVDEMSVPDYPVPTVKVKAEYNGTKTTAGKTTFVQAWRADALSDPNGVGRPDAVWQIASAGSVGSAGTTGTSSGQGAAKKTSTSHSKLIGMNPNREITLTLSPGSVVPGAVKLSFKDIAWKSVTAYERNGAEVVVSSTAGVADSAVWVLGAIDRVRQGDANWGDIIAVSSNVVAGVMSESTVGEINYQTGTVIIDMTKLQGEMTYDRTPINDYYIYYALIDLSTSQVRIEWTSKFAAQGFPQTYYLADSATAADGVDSNGRLREGKNIFVAFVDLDGNGAWSPGEPYGAVANVDVGWSGTSCEIEMMDTTPQMARIDLAAAIEAARDSGFEEVNITTDRGLMNLNIGISANEPCIYPGTNMPANVSSITKVRVVRNWINGDAGDGSQSYSAVVLERNLDLAVHPALTEADLLADGVYDLDWGTLLPASGLNQAQLASATYRIVIGDGELGEYERGANNLPVLFVNRFETQARQTPTVPDPALAEIVFAGRPTFRWSHVNSISKAYPAFQLKIYAADQSTVVYDSGVQQAPARDVNGMYEWTAPVYAGMVTPQGFVFDSANDYYWAVSMLDAKFTVFNDAETKSPFRLSCTGDINDDRGYGSIKVAVKYFGPLVGSLSTSAAALRNLIHVQAFTTADFTGTPVGEAYVTSVADIASTSAVTVNAIIRGVPAGTYYVRAYLDTDGDFTKSDWETWGYGCYVGDAGAPFITVARGNLKSEKATAATFPYTPRSYKVAKGAEVPVVTIYMEDADTDFDGFPDAWEMQTYGALATRSPISGNTYFATVNPYLLTSLSAYGLDPSVSSTTAHLGFTLMGSLMNGAGDSALMAASLLSGDSAGETTAVRIKSFSLEDGLTLEVVNESVADTAGVITFNDTADVRLYLVCASSPDFADAVEVPVKDEPITIRANDTVVEAVSAEELAAARAKVPNARFFKAVIK